MEERRPAVRDPDLTGRRVLVVGLGRSGLAAAMLAAAKGAVVTATDAKPISELGEAVAEARRCGIEVRAGSQTAELATLADLVVVSPGVPPEIELLRKARELKLPVWGEIELAARYCHGRVIGVTGSNGKSTVTTMIGAILEQAGVGARVGGNLDRPFADLLVPEANTVYVLELSSFQLETLESLRPEVAVLLNLSPDHLDRYADLESYAAAKARLLELQDEQAYAILNADDEASRRFDPSVCGQLLLFSTRSEPPWGGFVRDGVLRLRTEYGEEQLLELEQLPLRGEHNAANALAAALAARLAGSPVEAIVEGLSRYEPLPHRLEYVGTIDGVAFYDDSKATNPASTARALTAFEPGRVHLILGGRDKGADWDEVISLVARYARRVLLVGEAATMLAQRLSGMVDLVDCGSLTRAVAVGHEGAGPGDVLLLSPGCASFDQYRNFEERGEDFRRQMRLLNAQRGSDA
jgi:UDP-N-acetylmuramoylalanine--D-glutamate ligase